MKKTENIIISGKDIEYWKELGASAQLCKQRGAVLQKFLTQLKSENKKPIKRLHKKRFVTPLKTGDVFACYSKSNGCYGCGVALQISESSLHPWEEEYNFYALFAISQFTPTELPTIEQVLSANVKDVFYNGGCGEYNLPKRGIKIIGNIAERINADYNEFRGNYYRGVYNRLAVYLRFGGRPSFDDLISRSKPYPLQNSFPFQDKPMTFFFEERNLINLQ